MQSQSTIWGMLPWRNGKGLNYTVRINNSQHKLDFLAIPKPRLIGTCLRACRMLEEYAEPKHYLGDVAMAQWNRPQLYCAYQQLTA